MDDFFVGWLPPPRRYARFVAALVPVVLAVAAGTAVLLAARQQDPGPAEWDAATPRTLRGMAYAAPYAALRVPEGDGVRTVLLVEEGKHGAAERVRRFDGRAVEAAGTLLRRGDRWMLELAAGDDALELIEMRDSDKKRLQRPESVAGRPVTLSGEIVDAKCYLGAMKPGGGKTHKGCAVLCLAGGVPPLLATRDAAGKETLYLLVAPDGGPAGSDIHPYAGDPIEVTGVLEQHDDLPVLKAAAADIRRR